MKKVFISSVMKGFGSERSAVRTAVESISLRPVMAETFGAKPHSPQAACLEGVRDSDIYVGVLGKRYGFVGRSGKSAVEEEFEEARRTGKDVLVFVQEGELEPEQQAFYERIAGYEEGYFVDFFDNPQALQAKVTKALFSIVGQPEVKVLDSTNASEYVRRHVPPQRNAAGVPVVRAVIFPVRQGIEYFPPLDMEKPEVRRALLQRALFGDGALFSTEVGTQPVEGREHVGFEQRGHHNQMISLLTAHADGTLVWATALDSDRDAWFHAQFFIDQDEVQQRLAQFIRYAAGFYGGLNVSPAPSSFYFSVVLQNLQQKYFGPLPKPESRGGGISIPMDSLDDPLVVPDPPLKISRADVTDAEKLAMKLVKLVAREFKASGREYKPSGRW